ncbi:multidrug effflux MFS transporter [Ectothiorhodospiraceae bacterium WFHF3C12]|nr:multidrug effflux MFS transporter [Ectothiorhodospiraceae bacterium WFHF3C12]
MLKLDSVTATVVIASLVALGPLATDMYLPALPAMGQALGAGAGEMQLTLSVYMAGFAVAQLVCGPLSDRYGRKPVMLGGLGLFAAASIGCALAETVETILLMRLLQALGGATGPVLGRAAVRDIHEPARAAVIMSYVAMIMAVAPALAPTFGGVLLSTFGWPALFVFLAGYAVLAGAVLALALPEPLSPHLRQSVRVSALLRSYRIVLSDSGFRVYSLTNALVFGGVFAFLSGASFVLIDSMGVSAAHFGYYFAFIVVGYVSGSFAASRLSQRLGVDRLVLLGAAASAVGGAVMAALAWSQVYAVAAVIVPQMVYMFGVGLVLPQAMAGALAPFPERAGTASALFGFLQMTIASAMGVCVGQLHDGTSRMMALVIAGTGLLGLLVFATGRRRGAAVAPAGSAADA